MAHTDPLSKSIENTVARQVASRLSRSTASPLADSFLVPPGGAAPLTLCESLRVFVLQRETLDKLPKTTAKIRSLASYISDTGRWHHQICPPAAGGAPGQPANAIGYVRSRAAKADEAERINAAQIVTQIAIPEGGDRLARLLNAAILFLDGLNDTAIPADPLVRLVEIPSYLMTVLYLKGTSGPTPRFDAVLVAAMPPGMESSENGFAYETLYSSQDFLTRLRRTPTIQGVPERLQ